MTAVPGVYENGIFRKGDVRISDLSGKKILPIGNSRFSSVVQDAVFIDKSLLIADVISSGAVAMLFCCPRRFGKSIRYGAAFCGEEVAEAMQGSQSAIRE